MKWAQKRTGIIRQHPSATESYVGASRRHRPGSVLDSGNVGINGGQAVFGFNNENGVVAAASRGVGASGAVEFTPANPGGPPQARRSRSAQSAAPTIPASLKNSAGTIFTRGFTYLKNLACFALTPPPMMISSGQRMFSRISM